jgi:hypothetical protein
MPGVLKISVLNDTLPLGSIWNHRKSLHNPQPKGLSNQNPENKGVKSRPAVAYIASALMIMG